MGKEETADITYLDEWPLQKTTMFSMLKYLIANA